MKRCSLLILLLVACITAIAQADTVLDRYRRYLYAQRAADIRPFLASYDSMRQWPDIDYRNEDPAGWKPLEHLKRVSNLAVAWSDPHSPWHHDTTCFHIMRSALRHWLEKRYQSRNWWHNKIGVPQLVRDILVASADSLTRKEIAQALQVMAQNDEASWRKSTGANLVWCADLAFHYGAFTGDTALMRRSMEMIWKEVKVSTNEGVQPDFSFHQHGERLQIYHYGRAFLQDNIRLAWQTQGTPWAFPQEKISILRSFILNGWQWMARGIYTVPGTVDRAVSRPNTLTGADIRHLVPYLCELDPAHQTAYREIEAPLKGFRYYPRSDFAVFHHPQFSFFLKTLSDRTLPAESINKENLKGQWMHNGDGYFILNGNEYTNLMPTWDWEQLPGITSIPASRKSFTGSVSDGHSGLTVMEYNDGRKLWACYDNMMVCLMAGLKAPTTLDQCRMQGEVWIDTQQQPLPTGNHQLKNVRWIYHHKLAYILPEPAAVNLYMDEQEGSWQSVNASGSPEIVKEKIFKPIVQHTGGYAVVYCDDVRQLAKKERWRVLQNTKKCQALQFEDGTVMAAFYEAGNIFPELSVDRPCLILMKGDTVHVSDPSQKGGYVTIDIKGKKKTLQLPNDGTSVTL